LKNKPIPFKIARQLVTTSVKLLNMCLIHLTCQRWQDFHKQFETTTLKFLYVFSIFIRNILYHIEKWTMLALASDYTAFLFKVLNIWHLTKQRLHSVWKLVMEHNARRLGSTNFIQFRSFALWPWIIQSDVTASCRRQFKVKVLDIVRHSNNHYYAEINFIGPCNKAFSFQVSVIPYTKQLVVRRTELYSVRETKFAEPTASKLDITS
jgi:hypothetical protein